MKNILTILFITGLMTLTSCLESDDFDGLTDSKPDVAIMFPGREYDQQVGLGFITNGYEPTTSITYSMEVEGGDLEIESILLVEARAGDVNIGGCTAYAVVEDQEITVNSRTYDYTRNLDLFTASGAICNPVLDKADTYFEVIFTLRMSNGEQIVTMPVRGLFKSS